MADNNRVIVELGRVVKERAVYNAGNRYYKDNIVEYMGAAYIANPTTPDGYVTVAPWTTDRTQLNTGWRVFADGNPEYIEEVADNCLNQVRDALNGYQPIVVEGDVTNAPDEEDLTSVNVGGTDVLKFKDKAYTPLTYSGMGRVYLRKNMVNGVNTLTQDMFYKGEVGSRVPNTNTIYVIQYDFTLGENITVPANCVLEFDGGSISGNGTYTLTGKFSINDVFYKIFDNVVFVTNQTVLICDFIRPEWFGAKGDFDPVNNTGTDDSTAISAAIRAAEILNVGKIKFSSSNYLVVEGVHIKRGNIWLDGVRALLREDQWVTTESIISSRGSTLYCPADTSIITCDASFADPFRCTNIQFICYNHSSVTKDSDTHAINFTSAFWGPTWPFIVEYCYFNGFNRAIYFNSEQRYCVNKVYINKNAFKLCNYCVKFADHSYDDISSYGILQNLTWNFEFKDNCCHDNTHIIDITCTYGVCNIQNNNLEGDKATYIDGTSLSESDNFANYISLGGYSTLTITGNHFETMSKKLFQIGFCYSVASVDIDSNNVYGVSSNCSIDFKKNITTTEVCINIVKLQKEISYTCSNVPNIIGFENEIYDIKILETSRSYFFIGCNKEEICNRENLVSDSLFRLNQRNSASLILKENILWFDVSVSDGEGQWFNVGNDEYLVITAIYNYNNVPNGNPMLVYVSGNNAIGVNVLSYLKQYKNISFVLNPNFDASTAASYLVFKKSVSQYANIHVKRFKKDSCGTKSIAPSCPIINYINADVVLENINTEKALISSILIKANENKTTYMYGGSGVFIEK